MSCPELEKIHRQFCKFALNVPTSATNLGIYGELGRFPLNVKRYTRVILNSGLNLQSAKIGHLFYMIVT